MTGRVFVDTNVLVYAFDPSDPAKHSIARSLLKDLCARGDAVISPQVLSEFYVVVTRRIPKPLPHAEALGLLRMLISTMAVTDLHPSTVMLAVESGVPQGLSYWDALIWAASRENGVATVCSEDFSHGRSVEGVQFLNPFAPAP